MYAYKNVKIRAISNWLNITETLPFIYTVTMHYPGNKINTMTFYCRNLSILIVANLESTIKINQIKYRFKGELFKSKPDLFDADLLFFSVSLPILKEY